jgi:hypothetical protein
MTTNQLYRTLAKIGFGERPAEDDALALMIVLHTHRLRLGGIALTDRPGVSELAAITQRHAAEVIAEAWPTREDRDRTSREHWYCAFNARTPFEVVDDIAPEWRSRVERVRSQVAGSGLIAGLDPED